MHISSLSLSTRAENGEFIPYFVDVISLGNKTLVQMEFCISEVEIFKSECLFASFKYSLHQS